MSAAPEQRRRRTTVVSYKEASDDEDGADFERRAPPPSSAPKRSAPPRRTHARSPPVRARRSELEGGASGEDEGKEARPQRRTAQRAPITDGRQSPVDHWVLNTKETAIDLDPSPSGSPRDEWTMRRPSSRRRDERKDQRERADEDGAAREEKKQEEIEDDDDGEMEYGGAAPLKLPAPGGHSLRQRAPVDYTATQVMWDADALPRGRGGGARGRRPRGRPPGKRRKIDVNSEDSDDGAFARHTTAAAGRDDSADDAMDFDSEDGGRQRAATEGSRRSSRTAGKSVDYTTRTIDDAIRKASEEIQAAPRDKRRAAKDRAAKAQRMDDEEEDARDGRGESDDDGDGEVAEFVGNEDDDMERSNEDADARSDSRRAPQSLTDGEEDGVAALKSDPEREHWRREAAKYQYEVTRILGVRRVSDGPSPSPPPSSSSSSSPALTERTEYLVKWKDRGYKHCSWLDLRVLQAMEKPGIKSGLTRFHKKFPDALPSSSSSQVVEDADDGSLVQLEDGQHFNPDYLLVHRIISRKGDSYLVKWKGLGYEEATWESAADIDNDAEIARYFRYSEPPPARGTEDEEALWKRNDRTRSIAGVRALVQQLPFKGGRQLRDYQVEGVTWMVYNHLHKRPSLLADEMGLGKTAQTVAVCLYLWKHLGVRGPFLIVAPLTTVSHWQREFEAWTDFNAVIYHGTPEARDVIEQHEFNAFEKGGRVLLAKSLLRFNALIVPDSLARLPLPRLRKIGWIVLAVDEGHRMKNVQSELAQNLSTLLAKTRIILTGTPIQNNVTELWSVLHFLDPAEFPSEDDFLAEYGEVAEGSTEHLELLQARITPYFLRRLKEDVEKNIPPRQETLIEVDLSLTQKMFYKALYERDLSVLMRGSKADAQSIDHLCIRLRQCCQHPWLLKGVEDQAVAAAGLRHSSNADQAAILQLMVDASGKFMLLKKLLDALQKDGHRVLIFSQWTRVLDLIEDALGLWSFLYERIDGGVTGNRRQAAIDRFCKEGSDRFVFLLSTRAGGLGLNLQQADSIIIFDSDWNPQNDLQAIARSHRIGQTKEVQVYRLIAKNTYENAMFDRASKKLGLGHAIMGSMASTVVIDPTSAVGLPKNKEELVLMLRKGFYYQAEDSAVESTQLTEDTLDLIMQRDAKVIQYRVAGTGEHKDDNGKAEAGGSSAPSNRFAKATFVTSANMEEGAWNDDRFWERMFPEQTRAAANGEALFADDSILHGKRKRRMLHGTYEELLAADVNGRRSRAPKNGADEHDAHDAEFADSGSDSNDGDSDAEQAESAVKTPALLRALAMPDPEGALLPIFVQSLSRYGYGRWRTIREDMAGGLCVALTAATDDATRHRVQTQLGYVDAMTHDDLMYYTVGWLKMIYVYRHHKVLFKKVEEDDSEDEGPSHRRGHWINAKVSVRPVGSRGGGSPMDAIELHYGAQLSADARRIILEESERREAVSAPSPAAAAHAAADALSAEADKLTASKLVDPRGDAIVIHGSGKDEKKPAQSAAEMAEEPAEVNAAEIEHRHFLDLIELIPVHPSLLTKKMETEMRGHTAVQALKELQWAHQLQSFVVETADGHPYYAEWLTAAELASPFRRTNRIRWIHDKLGSWWRNNEDDWQLLRGVWIHGLDRLDALSSSPFLPFASRIGKAEMADVLNPLFAQRRDAVMEAEKVGPEEARVAETLFRGTPQYVSKLVRVAWPSRSVVRQYVEKLLSSMRVRFKAREKQREKDEAAARVQEEVRQREQTRQREEEKEREEAEERKRRKQAKKAKREADEALRVMMDHDKRDGDTAPERGDRTAHRNDQRADSPAPRAASGGTVRSPTPLPRVAASAARSTQQSAITNFFGPSTFGVKPKLPLVSTPTSSGKRRPSASGGKSPSSKTTPSSSTSPSLPSSSSHTSANAPPAASSSPAPHSRSPFSLFATSPERASRSMPSEWAMTLPRPSVDDEEEGDVDEDNDNNVHRAFDARKKLMHTTAAPAFHEDDDEVVILLSDSD